MCCRSSSWLSRRADHRRQVLEAMADRLGRAGGPASAGLDRGRLSAASSRSIATISTWRSWPSFAGDRRAGRRGGQLPAAGPAGRRRRSTPAYSRGWPVSRLTRRVPENGSGERHFRKQLPRCPGPGGSAGRAFPAGSPCPRARRASGWVRKRCSMPLLELHHVAQVPFELQRVIGVDRRAEGGEQAADGRPARS